MVLVRKFVYIKGKQVNEEDDAVIAKKAKEVFDVASKPSSSTTDEWALVVHHAFLHTLPRRRVEVDSVPRKRNHGPVDFAALLPAEILLHILSYLDYRDICAITCTSRDLRELLCEQHDECEQLWKRLCAKHFQTDAERTDAPRAGWKALFRYNREVLDILLSGDLQESLDRAYPRLTARG